MKLANQNTQKVFPPHCYCSLSFALLGFDIARYHRSFAMEIREVDIFETVVLTGMLLFFSTCAWLLPFVAANEDAILQLVSLTGDTWFVGLGLLLWFGYGSLRLTQAECAMDECRITRGMYFKKLVMVPFVPFLLNQASYRRDTA